MSTTENKEPLKNTEMTSLQSNIQQNSSVAIREDLVKTAITFLQNPKVRQSPFAQRKAFLERKGLTADEIATAVQRSGTADDENAVPSRPDTAAVVPVKPQTAPVIPQVSAWTKIYESMKVAVLISGASYGIYHLYQIYLAPMLFGKNLKAEDKYEKLTRSIDELRQSMADVVKNMVELQRHLTDNHERTLSVIKSNTLQRFEADSGLMNISELKDEIKSVKSLLLSSRQFAPTPTLAPVIPAWQLSHSQSTVAKQPEDSASQMQSSSHSKEDKVNVEEEVNSERTNDYKKSNEVDESSLASNGTSEDRNDATKAECITNGDVQVTDNGVDVNIQSATTCNEGAANAGIQDDRMEDKSRSVTFATA